jgi:outer membrane protein assembly factor BamA
LDIGYNTGRDSELRFGYQFEHQDTSVSTGSPILPSLHGDAGSLRLGWLLDGQDSPTIPSRGTRVAAGAHWYFYAPDAPRPFPIADINLSSFHPVSKTDSVFGVFGAGTAFGRTAGPLEQFTLGGPSSLAAYGPDEFRGNDALHLTLGYLHRVGQLPSFVGGKVMLGGMYQVGGAFERFGSGRYLNDVSVALLADTLIGPVLVGYSYGEAGRNRIYFAIGRLF